MFSSSTDNFWRAQGNQGFSSSRDSVTAAKTSAPSPGSGELIRSRSVSKVSGKSLSIGGLMPLSYPLTRDARTGCTAPTS